MAPIKSYQFVLIVLRSLLIAATAISTAVAQQAITVDQVVRVYDGDTITVNIDQWPAVVGQAISVRIRGIDTPEIRGQCQQEKQQAKKARDFVKSTLSSAQHITLTNIERGKYFRLVADVFVDDQSLAAILLQQQLARPYDGGSRQPWC